MAGPMPTNFRWLWYLVGLAGFCLSVVGVFAILGSAWDLGILIPVVVFLAIVVVAGILWFRRSLNAAVAAAPSRQGGSSAGGAGAPASPDAALRGSQLRGPQLRGPRLPKPNPRAPHLRGQSRSRRAAPRSHRRTPAGRVAAAPEAERGACWVSSVMRVVASPLDGSS